jgi:uncharacterized protein
MKDFIINLLTQNLPSAYYYHNVKHTLYVVEKTDEIGRYEKCSESELRLLNAAALWHDTGYIKTYFNHEQESCLLARQYLPTFGFSLAEIDAICGMIMATRIPQSPKSKLEEIIADADLEYLGTEDFTVKSNSLFKEYQNIKPELTITGWNKEQILFLHKHHYFTQFCIKKREPVKQQFLKELILNAK